MNKVSVIPLIRELCKDTEYLKEIIPLVGENNMKLAKGETKTEAFHKITIDLSKARKNVKESNVAFGTVPAVNQSVNRFTQGVKQLNSSSVANQHETKVFYKEEWLISLLKDWSYFDRA
jgi:hypothetical protein